MLRGNPHEGQLKAVIEVMNDLGPDMFHHDSAVVEELQRRGHWKGKTAETPHRTINMWFTQRPDIFAVGPEATYCLREAYRRATAP
jgi:hypothetical protein